MLEEVSSFVGVWVLVQIDKRKRVLYSAQEVHGTSNQTNLFATNSATFQITGLQFEETEKAQILNTFHMQKNSHFVNAIYYQMVHDSARTIWGRWFIFTYPTGACLNIMFTHPVPMRAKTNSIGGSKDRQHSFI